MACFENPVVCLWDLTWVVYPPYGICDRSIYVQDVYFNGKTTLYMGKRNISLERAECPLCNGIQLVMLLTQMSEQTRPMLRVLKSELWQVCIFD